jgi:hypothetical protein
VAAADIAPRTFLSYFASKEDAVFPNFDAALADFDRAMWEPPPGMTALAALRARLMRAGAQYAGTVEAKLEARLRRESPAVAACDLQHQWLFERRVVQAVGEDFGERDDALRPRLVAGAAVAALQASSAKADTILERDAEAAQPPMADPAALLDDAMRFLEGGLAGLAS